MEPGSVPCFSKKICGWLIEIGGWFCGLRHGPDGKIIFSACRFLPRCIEAIEAELCACREGLELALNQSQLPIIVESDCSQVVVAEKEKTNVRLT
jgi:hypothetical protein